MKIELDLEKVIKIAFPITFTFAIFIVLQININKSINMGVTIKNKNSNAVKVESANKKETIHSRSIFYSHPSPKKISNLDGQSVRPTKEDKLKLKAAPATKVEGLDGISID